MFVWHVADDETRVRLKGLSHDYINANYVNVRQLCVFCQRLLGRFQSVVMQHARQPAERGLAAGCILAE